MTESFTPERNHLQGLHWQCFGCGEENRLGLRLNIRLVGDRTEAEFTPIPEFQGAPGVAHAGVVAAALDEVMSQLIYSQLQLAVTRKIEVTYRRPLRVGQTYYFSARIVKQNAKIIAARAEARDSEGNQVAWSRGIYAPLSEERVAKFLDKEPAK
ncbi:MAG TPA: hotdog domain-containing protein [Symbiobacteriaceae bacterium]|nr:hotdog domain-containing protein [Symbiobacteriaceae bacterium]